MVSAWDSLHSATLELVRSTPIKQRLIAAYRRHLRAFAKTSCRRRCAPRSRQVMRSSGGVEPLRGEDAVTASVRKMSNQEADDCAALIVEIFGDVPRSMRRGARAAPRRSCSCAASTACRRIRNSRADRQLGRPPSSIELEFDRIPARRLLMARLAPQRIDQAALVPSAHLVRQILDRLRQAARSSRNSPSPRSDGRRPSRSSSGTARDPAPLDTRPAPR